MGADSSRVFVSYSPEDADWKDRLVRQLQVLQERLSVWDASQIAAGSEREREVRTALEAASVALFLVSAHSLTSPLLLGEEVPRLLARRSAGLRLVPVVVSPCNWQRVGWLASLEPRPREGDLARLSPAEAEECLRQVASEVDDLLQQRAPTRPGTDRLRELSRQLDVALGDREAGPPHAWRADGHEGP